MAAQGAKLATGWLELTVSSRGAQQQITQDVVPGATRAGDAAGASLGSRMLTGMKRALGVAAVTAAAVGVVTGLYGIGRTFDEVSDTIRTGTGATGAALAGLEDVAKQVGTSIPTSFEAAGSTVADLNTRLGLSGDTLRTVASQYLEAGRILGQDVDIQGTTAAFTAFRIEGEDVAGAMDTLFQVSQATGVGMNELARGARDTAPALQAIGFGFEDAISLVGSFDKAGLNSTQIMASMSRGLVNLAKDGEEPAVAYQRVIRELQGFVDAGDTAAALDLAGKVFGTRGASQFVGALQSGVLNMEDLMSATGATADTILGVAAETASAGEQWQIFKNKATAALEPLGSLLFNAVGTGLARVNVLFDQVGPAMSGVAAAVGPVFSQIGSAFAPLGAVFSQLLPPLLELWQALSPVSILFQALTPVIPQLVSLVSTLATSLGGALVGAITQIAPPLVQVASVLVGALTTGLQAILPPVAEFATLLGGVLAEAIGIIAPALVDIVTLIGDGLTQVLGLVSPLLTQLAPIFGQIVSAVTPLVSAVLQLISPLLQLIGPILQPLIQLFTAILTPILGLIQPILGLLVPALQFVATVLGTVIGWVAQAIGWFVKFVTGNQQAGAQFQQVWNTIAGFFQGIGRTIASIWNGMISGISQFVGKVIGFFTSIPQKIGEVFAGAGRWLYDAGRNIVEGLINGAGALLSNIGNFFLNLVPDWIKGPFKAALGINSPSRVFFGYGDNTAQGYIDGVKARRADMQREVTNAVPTLQSDPLSVVGEVSRRALEGTDGAGTGDTYVLQGITTRAAAREIAAENEKAKRRRMRHSGALKLAGVK